MHDLLKRFYLNRDGATAIEYGMIAALIAVVIIASLKIVGSKIGAKFSVISGNLN